ncbi:MAG: S9 family peptidase [Bacteroidia bacterium]
MQAPKAKKIPKELLIHGDLRIDNYYWLNDRENTDVIDYLNSENDYTKEQLKHTENFQDELYNEIIGRIKKDDTSVPYFKNGYWYYSKYEKGDEHPIFCRKKASLDNEEEIFLNVNELAKEHAYYHVAGMSVSPDNQWLAFGEDTVSRRIYTIRLKNLKTGEILTSKLEGTTGGAAWANDNIHLFFTYRDEQTLRSHKVMRYNLETQETVEVYREEDDTFYCNAYKSKSTDYIIISSSSTLTDEYRYLSADEPLEEFKVFQDRVRGMEYGISHVGNQWYVLTNWDATNFKLMECPVDKTEREQWEVVIDHREDTLIEGIETFKDFLVVEEKTAGLDQLRVINQQNGQEHYIKFNDETYSCWTGVNPEFDTRILRYGYSSLTTPTSIFDYNLEDKTQGLKKQQEIVGGYDPSEYESKRVICEARDGTAVPISLVYKKSLRQDKNPLLLYAYGSYGYSMDPYFSSVRLSLLNRGFIFAIAHIRGGEDLGREWYENGKLLSKKNTFYDFIDCGEFLVQEGLTSKESLYAMGGSAGGLLMGAVINMKPEIWNGVIAAVPFVDVVTTMLDDSIPLTTGEYDEWGNPNEVEYYNYIKSYSPYDNVESKEYPSMMVTTGLHDSQVQYWEPAKWVAKLRDMKTDNNLLLLHTNMETGHGGASGRFAAHKETAMEYAFLFMLEGISS